MSGPFKAAGILFTDSTHVIAGFQPGKSAYSGFGGSRDHRETIRETAFREALEELLEPEGSIQPLVNSLKERYKSYTVTRKGTYRFLILSFNELLDILKEAKAIDLKSQIYKSIPTTIAALLTKRRPQPTTEVHELILLPVTATATIIPLDPNLEEDLTTCFPTS
jgi:hypothetical protein